MTGILFGVIMAKSEAISWFRIQEMFRFQSFHMYGIITTAVIIGAIAVFLIKRLKISDIKREPILFQNKDRVWRKYIIGGTIFGLGWALTGACPGPIFVNIGYGYAGMSIVGLGAILGTYLYGLLKDNLPH